eukprot:CAMPEP_0184712710 /NCGR_PEP_ID=MMETSP0314-20130426/3207_1 /TAXON_ID=38298 /ORGANISM="Rhodella maculata, Strain CCMP 736" /LENGTH=182 /DNA_ID=CAMNT_0027175213 /DNA_START=46 /DNA_END=590 /DNA_ORIENTATION=+
MSKKKKSIYRFRILPFTKLQLRPDLLELPQSRRRRSVHRSKNRLRQALRKPLPRRLNRIQAANPHNTHLVPTKTLLITTQPTPAGPPVPPECKSLRLRPLEPRQAGATGEAERGAGMRKVAAAREGPRESAVVGGGGGRGGGREEGARFGGGGGRDGAGEEGARVGGGAAAEARGGGEDGGG